MSSLPDISFSPFDAILFPALLYSLIFLRHDIFFSFHFHISSSPLSFIDVAFLRYFILFDIVSAAPCLRRRR